MGHGFIGTEHLLLGLIHEHDGVAAVALRQSGVTIESTRSAVQDIIGLEPMSGQQGSPPFTPRAKKCLELSLREALTMDHRYIGTEHLLLGVLREGEGVACVALTNLGVDLVDLRRQVRVVLSGVDPDAEAAMTPEPSSVEERLQALEVKVRALAQMDEIVAALRGCPDRAAAVELLGAPPFGYASAEAQQVLNLRVDMVTEQQLQGLRTQIDALKRMLGQGD